MDTEKLSEIQFFGKITAGISHELKNVLAIIKETSGLMGDLMALSGADDFQHKERFQKSLETIRKQIEQGVRLITHLNKFAHSPDEAESEIDLNELLEEMAVLCGRYARLRNVPLSTHPSRKPVKYKTFRVTLQMVLFSCLEYCISHIPQNSHLEISVMQKDKKRPIIKFESDSEMMDNGDLDTLKQAAASINGEITKESRGILLILSYNA